MKTVIKFLTQLVLLLSNFIFSSSWWDIDKENNLNYPTVGDFRWYKDKHTIISKGQSKNSKSFYKINLVSFDTIIFLDSSIFYYDDKEILVNNWKLSKSNNYMLIESESEKVWRRSSIGYYYLLDIENKKILKVNPRGTSPIKNVKISPDSRWLSYVKSDNNLYIYSITKNREKKISKTGSKYILNGLRGWLYEEEFSSYDGYRWSPDSKYIAYIEEDQSNVKEYTIINELKIYPQIKNIFYPKAGELNPTVKIYVTNINGGSRRKVNLGFDTDVYYPWVEWYKSDKLWIMKLERDQKSWKMLYYDPLSGNVSSGIGETDATGWVDVHQDSKILKSGSLIHKSERDGYNHIYIDKPGGDFSLPVTHGSWEVKRIIKVDEEKELVYFTANKQSYSENHLYSIRFDGTGLKLLTRGPGYHNISMDPMKNGFIDFYSSLNHPPKISYFSYLGEQLSVLASTSMKDDNDSLKINTQLVNFLADDGETILNGILTFPINFDKSIKYPLIVFGYGMPGTQIVNDKWQSSFTRFLAKQGYFIFSMDSRGMSGRGQKFKNMSYGDMAKYLSRDHYTGIKWVIEQGFIDSQRVGAWGWSGGGYFTCLMLTKYPDLFKAGVAIAPVTDFRFYDTAYSERYLGLPKNNVSGYDSTSVLSYIKNLKGKLLLIHGTSDDNVHSQNSSMFINECIINDKPIDVMYYPNRTHGISENKARKHVYKKLFEYFKLHLKIG